MDSKGNPFPNILTIYLALRKMVFGVFGRTLSPWWEVGACEHMIRNLSITLGMIASEAAQAIACQMRLDSG